MRHLLLTIVLLVPVMTSPNLAYAESATPTSDQRTQVVLNSAQEAFVLEHMKTMLETLAQINQHLANQTPDKVASLVKEMQQQSDQKKPKGLGKSFPKGFRTLSQQMNKHWKQLMTPSQDAATINGTVSEILNQCNACHRSYKL